MSKLPPLRKPKPKTSKTLPPVKKAVKAQAARELDPLEEIEKLHLQTIADREEVSVPQFREYTKSPDAKLVLQGYIDQGKVERKWARSQGKYALTEAGYARLKELS